MPAVLDSFIESAHTHKIKGIARSTMSRAYCAYGGDIFSLLICRSKESPEDGETQPAIDKDGIDVP